LCSTSKGENYAVTAHARRAAGQDVFLIDPFGITGAAGHAMSWLDALDPDDPEVVSLSGALADMLVVRAGTESDPHWNDSARELLRGLLVYVAGLPSERRNMAELRHILTAPEDELAEILQQHLVVLGGVAMAEVEELAGALGRDRVAAVIGCRAHCIAARAAGDVAGAGELDGHWQIVAKAEAFVQDRIAQQCILRLHAIRSAGAEPAPRCHGQSF
jgi:hypothetical protein